MVVRVAVAVAVLVDVLDLEDLVVVDQADVVGVREDALLPALADAEDAMDAEEHALENVVANALADAEVDALADAEDVVGVQDAEAHVQAHAQEEEKARLVLHAIAAPDALVHVLRVLRVVDVVGVMDVVGVAAVHPIAMGALDVLEDAMVAVLVDARDHVLDAAADAADVQGAVLDAMAHVLAHVTDVVMDAVVDAKMHVQQLAQQRVLEHAKLKRLVP